MIDKVKDTLERYSMLKKGARVLLCVSGGGDSVAMLSVFNFLKKGLGLKLFIAHLNHALRGRDSDKDEEYVRRLSRRYKVPIVSAREDIKSLARVNRESLEQAARKARYNFFLNVARRSDIDIIATAHNRDDQAETVLMRLLRGTGLKGLRGISPVRKLNGFLLIRPLIETSRKEVEAYLKRKKIKPRLDTTNLKPKFFRNKLRLKLLPFLEKEYSPGIKDLLSNLADLLDEDYNYLNLQQEEAFKRLAKVKNEAISFSLAAFKREHLSIQRALARKAIELLKGGLESIEYRHWQELESLAYERVFGSIVHLPGAVEAIKTKTTLSFRKKSPKGLNKRELKPVAVNIPGVTNFGKKTIRAEIVKRPRYVNGHSKTEEYLDAEKITLPLILRLRRPGDRMMPLGMKGYKKIKDIFIDEKVPRRRRNNIPLVASANDEILWLCGIKMSDRCKISSQTRKALKLEYSTK